MPSTLPSRAWTLVLAAAGGLATETAFPAKSWWPMAFLGIALLLLALRRDSARWGAVVGFTFGLAFFLPHLWWANDAVGEPIGWLALSIAESGAVAAFGAAWAWTRRGTWLRSRRWARVIAVAVLWVAVEQLRGHWPFGGFPWGLLAYSQDDGPLVRLAALGGTVAVSGAVVVVGALLALALANARRLRIGSASAALVVAFGLVLVPMTVPLGTRAETGTLRVGAVQGNVSVQGAEALSQARAIAANHAQGTEALLEQVAPGELDVVLWPESASDIDPRTDADVAAVVDGAARAVGAPIVLGTQRFVEQPGQTRTRYNDYIVWQPGQGATASYTKQHPVPFGEYMPYRDFFRRFTSAVDLITTDMAAGTEPALLEVPVGRLGRNVPLATGICFEVAYDELVREAVRGGAELIVIPTNNASFGMTQESTQQLAMSRFRAVEHGRAVVQVSTVGVSGIISPNGVVQQRTGLFTAEQMIETLPLRTTLTVSDRLGQVPAWTVQGLAVLLLITGLAGALRARREHRATAVGTRAGRGGRGPVDLSRGRTGGPGTRAAGRGRAPVGGRR